MSVFSAGLFCLRARLCAITVCPLFVCGAIFKNYEALSAGTITVNFLLQLLRMFHTVLGITPPKPEHERAYLLLWSGALVMVILIMVVFALLIVPHIMR
jgi:hypothetical protein